MEEIGIVVEVSEVIGIAVTEGSVRAGGIGVIAIAAIEIVRIGEKGRASIVLRDGTTIRIDIVLRDDGTTTIDDGMTTIDDGMTTIIARRGIREGNEMRRWEKFRRRRTSRRRMLELRRRVVESDTSLKRERRRSDRRRRSEEKSTRNNFDSFGNIVKSVVKTFHFESNQSRVTRES